MDASDLVALISPTGTLAVRVTPKARGERIVVEETSAGRRQVKAYVTAPPEDGKANAAVTRLVAKALGVPKSAVTVAKGETSREKVLKVER